MTRLTIDPVFQQQLLASHDKVALCDESGRTIGYFMPVVSDDEVLRWARHEISDEEIEEALQQPGGCTTEELVERLRQL